MKTKITNFMQNALKKAGVLMLCLGTTVAMSAATVTFNGTTDSDWATGTNWSNGTGPASGDIVIIAAGVTAVVGDAVTANLNYVELLAGSNLTNNGTLNITPTITTKPGLLFQNAKFTNNGSLSISMLSSPNQYHIIEFKGTSGGKDTIILNGTNTFANTVVSGTRYLFYSNVKKTVSVDGTQITLGSASNGINFGLLKIVAVESVFTFESGFNIQQYTKYADNANYPNIYFEQNIVTFNNYANITTTPSDTQGANACIVMDINPANGHTISFNNYGTFTSYNNGIGIQMGCKAATGTPAVINVTNAGTMNMDMPSASVVLNVKNATTVNVTNSGTMNLEAATSAIKSTANLELAQAFTNTGTINVTSGKIWGDITAPGVAPTIANNTGGAINFNYGVPAGTTSATEGTVVITNSGGTIAGSCTFAAGTLATSTGTLSPGDNGTGIGKMILTPVSGAFVLSGDVVAQVNGKTTAGTDFDQIAFADACDLTLTDAVNLTMTVGGGYTPALNDEVSLIASNTVSGTFSSPSLASGWTMDYTGGDVAVVKSLSTDVESAATNTRVYVSGKTLNVNLTEASYAQVQVIDMTGRVVNTFDVREAGNKLDVNHLQGIYMVRVLTGGIAKNYKVVI